MLPVAEAEEAGQPALELAQPAPRRLRRPSSFAATPAVYATSWSMWSAHRDMNCCPAGAPNSVPMAAVRSLVLAFRAAAAAVKSGLSVAPARSAATASATCSPSSRSSSDRSRQGGSLQVAAWSGGSRVAASACPMPNVCE